MEYTRRFVIVCRLEWAITQELDIGEDKHLEKVLVHPIVEAIGENDFSSWDAASTLTEK
jgi:hypothetical protein